MKAQNIQTDDAADIDVLEALNNVQSRLQSFLNVIQAWSKRFCALGIPLSEKENQYVLEFNYDLQQLRLQLQKKISAIDIEAIDELFSLPRKEPTFFQKHDFKMLGVLFSVSLVCLNIYAFYFLKHQFLFVVGLDVAAFVGVALWWNLDAPLKINEAEESLKIIETLFEKVEMDNKKLLMQEILERRLKEAARQERSSIINAGRLTLD